MFRLKCSQCSFRSDAATEDDAETAAFNHCRSLPDHTITCTRPAHHHLSSIPVIVFTSDAR